jgi:hypothetical protein
LDPKTLEIHGFWPKALQIHVLLCQKNIIHVALLLLYIKMFEKQITFWIPFWFPFWMIPLLDPLSTWAASTNKVVFSLAYYF